MYKNYFKIVLHNFRAKKVVTPKVLRCSQLITQFLKEAFLLIGALAILSFVSLNLMLPSVHTFLVNITAIDDIFYPSNFVFYSIMIGVIGIIMSLGQALILFNKKTHHAT